tara:strand:- start:86 stop:325 length:240 start_codon:yes stop_codon:yes gene_type:complete
MKKPSEIKCIHRSFNFTSKDDIRCAECGSKVLIYVPEDENEEAYFEILEHEPGGTFVAFHRSYREQMYLWQNSKKTRIN